MEIYWAKSTCKVNSYTNISSTTSLRIFTTQMTFKTLSYKHAFQLSVHFKADLQIVNRSGGFWVDVYAVCVCVCVCVCCVCVCLVCVCVCCVCLLWGCNTCLVPSMWMSLISLHLSVCGGQMCWRGTLMKERDRKTEREKEKTKTPAQRPRCTGRDPHQTQKACLWLGDIYRAYLGNHQHRKLLILLLWLQRKPYVL